MLYPTVTLFPSAGRKMHANIAGKQARCTRAERRTEKKISGGARARSRREPHAELPGVVGGCYREEREGDPAGKKSDRRAWTVILGRTSYSIGRAFHPTRSAEFSSFAETARGILEQAYLSLSLSFSARTKKRKRKSCASPRGIKDEPARGVNGNNCFRQESARENGSTAATWECARARNARENVVRIQW